MQKVALNAVLHPILCAETFSKFTLTSIYSSLSLIRATQLADVALSEGCLPRSYQAVSYQGWWLITSLDPATQISIIWLYEYSYSFYAHVNLYCILAGGREWNLDQNWSPTKWLHLKPVFTLPLPKHYSELIDSKRLYKVWLGPVPCAQADCSNTLVFFDTQ